MSPTADDAINLLPHRPPFRFVDAVDEVVPGVLQLEALAQTGGIAILSDARYAGSLPLFGGVEDVRFRRVVRPGDELVLRVEMERLSARGGWGRGVATVDDAVTCRARLLFAIA